MRGHPPVSTLPAARADPRLVRSRPKQKRTEMPDMPAKTNRLTDETSPYLLQHAENPVDWWPWCPQALALAKKENKPILLSVGYAACHWCHVMAHESFEVEATAAVMNRHFVNIKVDREERPDLDAIYQQALQLIGEQGGWPLTIFLTPDAEPFWGGTYFPDTARFGRPPFVEVLERISELFAEKSDAVESNRRRLREALEAAHSKDLSGSMPEDILSVAADGLVGLMDPLHGGVQGAPKFPQAAILSLLWRAYCASGDEQYRDAVLLALKRMSMGGIYDHLGGGFARYSTDAQWLAPHFEKMLYDNAQLIELLTMAWQETGNILFKQRVSETITWLTREMALPGGAFAGTLDADSEGVEGKFSVWDLHEIEVVLGDEAAFFAAAYDARPGGNWEGHVILNRSASAGLLDDADEARLAAARRKLLQARAARIRPARDDKVLADWNGLMIAALANAGAVFAEPDWIAAGEKAFAFIVANMRHNGDALHHSWCNGRAQHAAMLDDYAQMARAALMLYEVTGTDNYLDESLSLAAQLNESFWSAGPGGFHMSSKDAKDLLVRPRSAHDGPTPAGNAVAAEVFARLFYLTGEQSHAARAEDTITAFAGEILHNIFPLAGLIGANDFLRAALQIVVMGARGEAATNTALAVIYSVNLPNRVVQMIGGEAAKGSESLGRNHPAKGKTGAAGTVFICRGQQCSLPLEGPDEIRHTLLDMRKTPS